MALGLDLNPVARFIDALMRGSPVEWMMQAVVALGALFLGWLFARQVCSRVLTSPRWQFGKGDFRDVAYPLFGLGLVWLGKLALHRLGYETALLEIVQPLLIAFAFIRVARYVLGHVIPDGPFQHAVIRLVRWAAWIVVVLHVTGLLPEILANLEHVGFTFGKDRHRITALDITKGVTALFLTIVLAMWISRITESRVLAAQTMEMTTRVVITKVVRIATLFIAVFIALPMAGIDVTTLSIFSGALGVGLGFGLQKIASNYVSGFIVLLDRSLRIGDVVTVDGRRGEVTAIESRYTVIKGGDGVESIIPNEKLITESVNHHSYSTPQISLVLGVWVTYESDIDKACEVLVSLAQSERRVLPEPRPVARVKQLGENGIELDLTVWLAHPAASGEGDVKSALYKELLRRFRAEGIGIPYPHRDVRVIATPAMAKGLDVSGP
jgi:small-conductance mechanosensitive channel